MNLQDSDRPSIARVFFQRITGDPDPADAIKRLINPTMPVFESEWLDLKGAEKINPQSVQENWSKALAGFANTQGGVLIWGLDARKDAATGVDAARGESLVKHPAAFKSRLNELHHVATEPPVLGVKIEAYTKPGSTDEGFVICFIPESPFRPHRAEHAGRQYFIRAGDDFVTPSVSLLRNLFYPQSRCLLVPTFRVNHENRGGAVECVINGYLQNKGSATAFDTFVTTHCDPNGVAYSLVGGEGWETGPYVPYRSRATRPIHPGVSTRFLAAGYSPNDAPTLRMHIFAKDAEPTEWITTFTKAEIQSSSEKECERRSLQFRPD